MTDPIADMLTRLRNANSAYHDQVVMPHSKLKVSIAEILQREGYIAGHRTEDAEVGKVLVIELKYGRNRERASGLEARPAGLREVDQPAPRPRRPGRRDHLDVERSPDRAAGAQERRGRRSPRLRLVRG